MSASKYVHIVLFTVALLYGANYTIAKIAMPEYVLPFGFIFIRVVISSIIFWIYHWIFIKEKIKSRDDFVRLILCGLFGAATNQLVFFHGLSMTTPINASIIMTISPALVFVVAYVAQQERITWKKVIGIMIGAVGVYLFITKDGVSFADNHFVGDFYVLLNATSYALYLVIVKPLMKKYHPMTVVKWIFLFGSLIVIPFGWQEFTVIDWNNMPIEIWLAISYVVIGVTVLAYFLNAWGLRYVNSSVVGIYIYLQPVLATIVATAVGSDTITWVDGGLALMIMSGVYLTSVE